MRDSDLVARIGGDEFGALMRGLDEVGCAESTARLEAAITSQPGVDGVPLSVAIGYTSCPPAHSLSDAQRVAHARTHEQKRRREPKRAG